MVCAVSRSLDIGAAIAVHYFVSAPKRIYFRQLHVTGLAANHSPTDSHSVNYRHSQFHVKTMSMLITQMNENVYNKVTYRPRAMVAG